MNDNIVFLAVTDNFPVEYSANNSKNELLAKALVEAGGKASIINGIPGYKGKKINTPKAGVKDDICYYIFKKGSSIVTIFNLFKNYSLLKKLKKKNGNNYLLTGYNYFPIFLFYVFIAKLLRYKIVILITEWHLYFENQPWFKRFNYILFDHFFGYFVDGIMPISEKISEKVEHFNKPILKIPILADYDSIKPSEYSIGSKDKGYFLYCGDISYWNIIEFTVDSYKLLANKNPTYKLHLVVNGKPEDINRVHNLLDKKGLNNSVIVRTKLPFNELIEQYKGALALLIPLRTQKQDTARFPHKIGEYIATGRPIITGNVGEISHYFSNNTNAYIANEFSIESYAYLMNEAGSDQELANAIGAKGRKLGEENFHYLNFGTKIINFLDNL